MNIVNHFSLNGRVAVVTGGAGYIGSAVAKALGLAGATVLVCDLEKYDEVSSNLRTKGIKSLGYYIDASKPEAVEIVSDEIKRKYEKLDILVNCAGGNLPEATTSREKSFFDLPLQEIEKVVSLNFFGGAVIPCMIFGKLISKNPDGGAIINISSLTSIRPLTRVVAYSAAKAAVNNFTQWLAVHMAMNFSPKIRVNAIAPGFFISSQNRFLLVDQNGYLTERGKKIINNIPMGRFGATEDIMGTVVWLASNASQYVTGTVVPVDGGFSAYTGV